MAVETATETKTGNGQKVPSANAALAKVGATTSQSTEIPLDQIIITPEFNIDPKRMQDEASIRQLAKSIEATGGLLQDVLVGAVPNSETGKTEFHLISGFRRYAAFKMLGKKTIGAKIRAFDTLEALIANGAENTGREAPHPAMLSKRLAFIKETYFKGDKEADNKLAEAFGITKKHVQNLLRMRRQLAPQLLEIFEGPSASLSDESPSLKWLIEQSKESHEDQLKAFELRFGAKAGEDEDDDKPAKNGRKSDDENSDKPKKTRVRNRDEVLWAKDKILKKLTDAQVKAGHEVTLSVRALTEPKQRKLTERDRVILREAFAWVLDANRGDFLIVTEPEEEAGEDD
jgi:ParB/RepB/Spo0J family partition protein